MLRRFDEDGRKTVLAAFRGHWGFSHFKATEHFPASQVSSGSHGFWDERRIAMATTTGTSSSMGNQTKDMGDQLKESAREAGRAASAASGDIRDDLTALRDDVARLGAQLVEIVGTRGNAAWQKAEGMISDAQGKGAEAVDAVRDVGDAFGEAIDQSLKRRPYTTLALAAAIGFIFGATWRR
jgi:ElaB/YqjD/DUF883 family membrane-anchored ribosome-binding protein